MSETIYTHHVRSYLHSLAVSEGIYTRSPCQKSFTLAHYVGSLVHLVSVSEVIYTHCQKSFTLSVRSYLHSLIMSEAIYTR